MTALAERRVDPHRQRRCRASCRSTWSASATCVARCARSSSATTGPPHGPLAFLAFEDFQRLVEGFGDIDELLLQGLGEPTMHPRFFDMVAWATARGIRVSTNSNLPPSSGRRARLCIQRGVAALHVSGDAATPRLYERIRRGTRFSKVIRNLRAS
jgi:MoaA/NifB/PqqE/SkfB family radical SAM enzyme